VPAPCPAAESTCLSAWLTVLAARRGTELLNRAAADESMAGEETVKTLRGACSSFPAWYVFPGMTLVLVTFFDLVDLEARPLPLQPTPPDQFRWGT